MLKAIVTGAAGKMGSTIIKLLHATDGIKLEGAVEWPGHAAIGKDAGENIGLGALGVIIEPDLRGCIHRGDVLIDFTSHEVSLKNLEIAAAFNRWLPFCRARAGANHIERGFRRIFPAFWRLCGCCPVLAGTGSAGALSRVTGDFHIRFSH